MSATTDTSLISIIMPVHNEERYLRECLDSIIEQTYPHWELIGVNDHSTDASLDIMIEYAAKEPRMHVLNNGGMGISDALRMGFQKSTGDYIHRMDADDVMDEEKLASLLEVTSKGMVGCGQVAYFAENEVGAGYQAFSQKMNDVLTQKSHRTHAFQECFLPSPSWLMTRDDFKAIGGFNIHLLPEDYDLYFRALQAGYEFNATAQIVHHWRDYPERSSRILPEYQPINYIPLKVYYFLRIFRVPERPLVLWGAGKRGKRIASELLKKGQRFHWLSENKKKWSVPIYGKRVLPPSEIYELEQPQVIVSISNPLERQEVKHQLQQLDLTEGQDFWWFC